MKNRNVIRGTPKNRNIIRGGDGHPKDNKVVIVINIGGKKK